MLIENLPKIMLVDMNSFFASVEQQSNPKLRGHPVGVCASIHPTSCLIAASKEAKALGIKTGTLTYKAKKIYPKIILIQAEPEKYREVNRQINRIFSDYTKNVEAYSIDESFLDLHGSNINPLVVGAEIKKRIRQEIGEWLTCSVGLGDNKFMAKLAADMEKPDGLSVVWRSSLPEIYKNKKLTDLWGIAHGWQRRLAKLNITNPAQLLDYPVQNLISLFGKSGLYIWERVNGLEQDVINGGSQITDPKSFGHSWVLNFRTTDKNQLEGVILRLAEKASRRMRREGFIAAGMYLVVRLVDGNYFHRSKKLRNTISSGWELYREALNIWKSWKFSQEAMHIAVGFTHLSRKVEQLSLFPSKFNQILPTLDKINDKYGEFTIRSGLLTETNNYAPDAIAFGK